METLNDPFSTHRSLKMRYNQPMIENVHDKFFKQVFSHLDNVRDFLTLALPEKVQTYIDFDEITLDPTSYVSPEMAEYFCDMVVQTTLKNLATPVDIYVILEHK